jgi:PAS domain S-box-containing protein
MILKVPNNINPFKLTLIIAILGVVWFVLLECLVYYTIDPQWFDKVWILKNAIFLAGGSCLLYLFFKSYIRKSQEVAQGDLRRTVQNLQSFVFKYKQREDGEFIYTFSEGKIAQEHGRMTEAVFGKTLAEASGPIYAKFLKEYYERAYRGEVVSYELSLPHRDSVLFTTLSPIVENGKVVEVVGSSSDITTLKQMEEDLKKSNQRIHNILESITEGFFAMDHEWRFTYINTQGAKMLMKTKEELLGNSALDVFPYDEYEWCYMHYEKALIQQVPIKFESFLNQMWLEERVYPTPEGISVYFVDVTEAKESAEYLRKSDKLTAVGQLAAGVAHEIRNPLTALRGFVQLIQSTSDEKHKGYTDIMLSELERIEFIISEFLVLAKPQVVTFHEHDLITLMKQTITIVETQANINNVQIQAQFESNLPLIRCEPNQLKQVFINILKNAIEAMPHGGEIKISLSRADDQNILIRFTDQGCGISEERMTKLGEPFYTTKEKGTGLGLMVSYKIIESHRGRISVHSQESKGTSFDILLPSG